MTNPELWLWFSKLQGVISKIGKVGFQTPNLSKWHILEEIFGGGDCSGNTSGSVVAPDGETIFRGIGLLASTYFNPVSHVHVIANLLYHFGPELIVSEGRGAPPMKY